MKSFTELERIYQTDAAFNKAVNLFHQLIAEHGFLPSEIREALFLAQYKYEINHPTMTIRTQEDWDKINQARELMKDLFVSEELNEKI